jgi:hypothetical protein
MEGVPPPTPLFFYISNIPLGLLLVNYMQICKFASTPVTMACQSAMDGDGKAATVDKCADSFCGSCFPKPHCSRSPRELCAADYGTAISY